MQHYEQKVVKSHF